LGSQNAARAHLRLLLLNIKKKMENNTHRKKQHTYTRRRMCGAGDIKKYNKFTQKV